MDVASLSSLPVGIRWWRAPEPALSIIVKATFSLAGDGIAPLATVQEPLGLDAPYPDHTGGDILFPSDFAPLKARADVLLVGQLWAARPTTHFEARLLVDQLDRRFCAITSVPTSTLPLVRRYLRANPSAESQAVQTGPSPWRGEGLTGPAAGAAGDFSLFNVAPPEQQLDLLRSSAKIRLEGMLRGVEHREVCLPGLRPQVRFFDADGATESSPQKVPLRCDTLWIDTERQLCTLTWRGVIMVAREALAPGSFLAVALQDRGLEHSWATIQPQIADARWVQAVEPTGPLMPAPWVRQAPAAASLPLAAVLPGAKPEDEEVQEDEDLSTAILTTVPSDLTDPSTDDEDLSTAIHATLPSDETAPPSDQTASHTAILDTRAPSPPSPLPFTQALMSQSMRIASFADAVAAQSGQAGDTMAAEISRKPGPELPAGWSRPQAPSAATSSSPSSAVASAAQPRAVLPRGQGGSPGLETDPATDGRETLELGDPEQLGPRAMVESGRLLPVALYAEIKAALWAGGVPLAEVLAQRDLDEATWRANERRQEDKLAEEGQSGSTDLSARLLSALVRARAERPAPLDEELSLDEWVELRLEVDSSEDPDAVLEARGLTSKQWSRLKHGWHKRVLSDPKLAKQVRAKLVQARKARGLS